MKDLFLFYVGGAAPGANIEVHDVQFVAAEKPEDAFDELTRRWYGTPGTLHIDTYSRVNWADGHDVALSATPAALEPKLWFLNMGGYRPGLIPEVHACDLFVAATEEDAKARAKASLLNGVTLQHTDNQIDVDDCLQLTEIDGLHIHLSPNASGPPTQQPEFQGFLRL